MNIKNHHPLFFFLLFFAIQNLFAQNTWVNKVSYPGGGRAYGCGFSIGNKGYVGGGSDSVYLNYSDFWEYNSDSNTWTKKNNFVHSLAGAIAFSIGNKGYVATGINNLGKEGTDLWEYNPSADSWTQKANFPGPGRGMAVGFSIGNKGYIGTGVDNNFRCLKDFWEYNSLNDTWTKKADFGGAARIGAVGFSIGNKGYIGTGSDSSGSMIFGSMIQLPIHGLRKIIFQEAEPEVWDSVRVTKDM